MRWSEFHFLGRGPIKWLVTDGKIEAVWDVDVETGLDDVAPNSGNPNKKRIPPLDSIPPGGVGDTGGGGAQFILIDALRVPLNTEGNLGVDSVEVEQMGGLIPVDSIGVVVQEA